MDILQMERIEKAMNSPEMPAGNLTYDDSDNKKRHVPRSTLIIFWIFIGYMILSFIAAVYFVTTTKVKIFNLNQLATLSTNNSLKSIDLPICFSRTNQTALRSSILENIYSGKVNSFQNNLSTQSANLNSSITLQRGNNLFTYFIKSNEIRKLIIFNPKSEDPIKRSTLEGLRIGDSILIKETLNLRRVPQESKTKIELEIL